jgi:4-oxalocrotonate tautomerase
MLASPQPANNHIRDTSCLRPLCVGYGLAAAACGQIHPTGDSMPIVTIQVTREGVTAEQKAELIKGATDLLVRVLKKDPATTFIVIDEVDTDNWGVGGEPVSELRRRAKAAR